jgi:catechol 2,3-dioxygenase
MERFSKTQRHIRRDSSATVQDSRQRWASHSQMPRDFCYGSTANVIDKNFSRMGRIVHTRDGISSVFKVYFSSSIFSTPFGLRPHPTIMPPIHPQTRIGHVHLKVADLDRALGFYRDVLGFKVTQRIGNSAAFLAAGDYHHHIGLNTWESLGGGAPAPGTTGLYHLAILYPTRAELADGLGRVLRAGITLDGAADHGVSHALYLRDPDDNGVELYWDVPVEQWPRTANGELAMVTRPLDLHALLAEADVPAASLGPEDLA